MKRIVHSGVSSEETSQGIDFSSPIVVEAPQKDSHFTVRHELAACFAYVLDLIVIDPVELLSTRRDIGFGSSNSRFDTLEICEVGLGELL
jgi:hypothetical protein